MTLAQAYGEMLTMKAILTFIQIHVLLHLSFLILKGKRASP